MRSATLFVALVLLILPSFADGTVTEDSLGDGVLEIVDLDGSHPDRLTLSLSLSDPDMLLIEGADQLLTSAIAGASGDGSRSLLVPLAGVASNQHFHSGRNRHCPRCQACARRAGSRASRPWRALCRRSPRPGSSPNRARKRWPGSCCYPESP